MSGSVSQFTTGDRQCKQLAFNADQQGLSLHLCPMDSSLVVYADIEKLERVLTNLIGNAIRHCNDGDTVLVKLQDRGKA